MCERLCSNRGQNVSLKNNRNGISGLLSDLHCSTRCYLCVSLIFVFLLLSCSSTIIIRKVHPSEALWSTSTSPKLGAQACVMQQVRK